MPLFVLKDERPREDRSTAARRVRAAPEHGEAPGQGGALADRLREDPDLDVATEALGRAERSAELEVLGARKRGWAAGALLSEVADACRTLDEAVSFVHVELAALGGAPAEAAAEGGGALPPPLEVRHGPPALPAGAAGQCAVPLGVPPAAATHAQAARVVGTLMVVELARHCAETACSAALQGCARRRAEAMLLEAIAEQHMTEAELPARGTACGASCADVVKAGPPSRASAQSEGPGAAETSTEPSSRASAQIECSGAPAAERRPHPRAATLASGATVAVSETFSRAGAQSVDLGSGVAKAELLSRASSREAPTELPSRAGTRATEAVAEVHYCAGSRCEGPATDEEDTLGVPEELLSACFAADFGPILEDFAKDPTVRLMAGEAAQLGAGLRAHSALELPAAGPRPPTPEPMGAVPAPSAWWRRRPEGAPATLFGLSPCRRCLAGSAPGDKVAQHAVALRVWLWARAQQSLALGLMRGLGPSAVAHLHLERAQARLLELAWLRTVRRQEAEAALDARLSALRRAARFLGPLGADAAGASGLLASEVALHAAEVRGSLGRAAEAEAASAAAAGARASLAPAGLARGADEGEDEVPQLWGTLRALGLLESACAQHSSRGPGQ
ncbi:unnamed protein product [Prorocentrum cordatum]|uniref:Spindle pole body component n=1 Tax=Prorocentrum cordatum TaxID=2364126 RepID=A0ABN9V1L0_9DINO|nr:unnamed protein product [Polarella glacialis]